MIQENNMEGDKIEEQVGKIENRKKTGTTERQ